MAFAALFDSLYCPEENLDMFQEPAAEEWPEQQQQQPVVLDDELPALFEALRGKEELVLEEGEGYGGKTGRESAVRWAARAAARLGFSALTAALATAYLDRCFLGGALRLGDWPWMARLAAVACVTLAAKVEETRVPVLLDLQLCAADGGDAYVFEPKTVRRMELLVLSALGWWMHPVTPLSFLHPVLAAGRLHHCETALLAVMPDWRWPHHRPSAWAAAVLLVTAGCGSDDHILALINAPKDEVAECAKILSGEGFTVDGGGENKRKRAAAAAAAAAPPWLHSPEPTSPSGVIGAAAYFSCESSSTESLPGGAVTAWPVSVSSSPEPTTGRSLKRVCPDEESCDAWPQLNHNNYYHGRRYSIDSLLGEGKKK